MFQQNSIDKSEENLDNGLGKKRTSIGQQTSPRKSKMAMFAKISTQEITDQTTIRVLAADDEDMTRKILDRFFSTLGHNATIVPDGDEALEFFKAYAEKGNPFNIVFMDLNMKGTEDGIDAIANIREHEKKIGKEETPIIVLTSNDISISGEKALAAGANEYMKKPCNKNKISNAILQHTKKGYQDTALPTVSITR